MADADQEPAVRLDAPSGRRVGLVWAGNPSHRHDRWRSIDVDFWNLAGFVRQMDLVISVDTAVCHLAGALGVPTWTLLAHGGEWRWMSEREDTP